MWIKPRIGLKIRDPLTQRHVGGQWHRGRR